MRCSNSSFGASLEWRAFAIFAIVVLLAAVLITYKAGRRTDAPFGLVVLLGTGYYWAQTESSHATALSEQPGAGILQALSPLSNVVHLLATAIWIGGIFYFVAVLLPVLRGLTPVGRSVVLRDSITSFSQVALVTVPLVALSGTIIYLAEQPSVESTLNTGYGREVLIKVGLLAVLMIPAAYNLRRVGPGLVRFRDKIGPALQALANGFRRSIRAEALLVSTVLIFSALLTLSAPATDPSVYSRAAATEVAAQATASAPVVAAIATPVASPTPGKPQLTATTPPPATLTLTQTVRGVDVSLTVMHNGVDDDLGVTMRDTNGPILACGPTPTPDADCALTVKITLTDLEDNTGSTVVADPTGDGGFAVPEGPYLPFDGAWQVLISVRRYNQPNDVKAAFRYLLEGASLTGKISDYVNVEVATDPDPPRSGEVAFTFHLTDNNGQPVNDATIVVQGLMPAHGHITEVEQMSNTAGTYTTSLLMPMSGGWSLEMSISRPDHDTVAAEVALDLESSDYDLTPYPSPNAPISP